MVCRLELVEVVNVETAEAVVVVVGEDEEQSRELSRNGFVMKSGHNHLHNVWGKSHGPIRSLGLVSPPASTDSSSLLAFVYMLTLVSTPTRSKP